MFKYLSFLLFTLVGYAQITTLPPATGGGGSATASGYSAAVSAQTTLTVSAATHGQGTSPVAGCFDNATPAVSISCSYTRNTSGDVVFTWSPAFTGTVNIWAGAGTSGISGGGNLTTVGAIPYVSASGVLNQDATKLFWDSTNGRLGVGTASPNSTVEVSGITGITGGGSTPPSGVGGIWFNYIGNVGTIQATTSGSQGRQLNIHGYPLAFKSSQSGSEIARFSILDNLLIGTTTDSGYKLEVANSGTSGTLRVYDATATTGVSRTVFRNGAGQSATEAIQFQISDGSVRGRILTDNAIFGSQFYYYTDLNAGFRLGNIASALLELNTSGMVQFSSTASYSGTKDLGLARNAAGVLEINNGTAGTYRDLLLRYLQNTGVSVATLPAAAAGNAGSMAYVTDASATTIGSTVAGGGANKVMVWSNGTAWKIYAN